MFYTLFPDWPSPTTPLSGITSTGTSKLQAKLKLPKLAGVKNFAPWPRALLLTSQEHMKVERTVWLAHSCSLGSSGQGNQRSQIHTISKWKPQNMNNHEDHSFLFLLLVTSEASYCRANLERVRGYWPWNRFEKTREYTESFLSPNMFHSEPGGSRSLGMCLYRIWRREQSSPFLLRAGIPHILLMRTALKGFGAHIWKTSSPFLSQVLLVPAAKGAGQGTELTGQAGSGKDSPERPAQLTSFSEAPRRCDQRHRAQNRLWPRSLLQLLMKNYFISPGFQDDWRESKRWVRRKKLRNGWCVLLELPVGFTGGKSRTYITPKAIIQRLKIR